MVLRYIANDSIALRYSAWQSRIVVGGKTRYLADMRTIMKEYFRIWDWKERRCGANKITLTGTGGIVKFNNGIERLREAKIEVDMVISFDRIMY